MNVTLGVVGRTVKDYEDRVLEMTARCIDTLLRTTESTGYNCSYVFCDNHSPNWRLMALYGDKLSHMANKSVTFRNAESDEPLASCWNKITKIAKVSFSADIVVLLNNDMTFNSPDWLGMLLAPFRLGDKIAATGSVMMSWNAFTFLEGSCLAFKVSAADTIQEQEQYFDPQFTFTCEEVDFCERLRRKGLSLVPTAVESSQLITHLHHGTMSLMFAEGVNMLEVMHENRRRLCRKWGLPEQVDD